MKKRKSIAFIVLTIVVVIAAVFLYFKFYGKNIFEAKLSEILERKIRFKNFSVRLDKYTVEFENFRVLNKTGFKEKNLFDADKLTLILDRESFKKEKKIVFSEIIVEKGTLHIERNRGGALNLARNYIAPSPFAGSMAYAVTPKPTPIYNFAKNVRKLTIKNSAIEFKDYRIFDVPFGLACDNFNLEVNSSGKIDPGAGGIPIRCSASFNVPNNYGNGRVSLDVTIWAYEYFSDVDASLNTRAIDLMQFFPYLDKYTPFSFREGVFSSKTSFKLQNNNINALATMVFHRLSLHMKPGMQNAQFFQIATDKLLPYLTSGRGEVIFDFVVTGPLDKPRVGPGPQLMAAISMAAVNEISSILQGLK